MMTMPSNLTIDTDIQIGLLAVAIVAIFMTWWQLRLSVKSQRIQLLHDMGNEIRSLHLKLVELMISIKGKKQKDTTGEYDALVTEYLNYMEHLSLLINEKYIDEKIAKKIFRRIIIEDTPKNFEGKIKEEIYTEYSKLLKKWTLISKDVFQVKKESASKGCRNRLVTIKIVGALAIIMTLGGTILGLYAYTDSGRKYVMRHLEPNLTIAIKKFFYPNKYDDNTIIKQQARGEHKDFKIPVTFNYLDKEKSGIIFESMKNFILDNCYRRKEIDRNKIRSIALAPFWHMGDDSTNPDLNMVGIYLVEETEDNKFLEFNDSNCTELMKASHLVTTQNAILPRLDEYFGWRMFKIATLLLIIACALDLILMLFERNASGT